jgi:hypothetical protein
MLLVADQDHHIVGSLIVGWDGGRFNMYGLAVVPHLHGRSCLAQLDAPLRAEFGLHALKQLEAVALGKLPLLARDRLRRPS